MLSPDRMCGFVQEQDIKMQNHEGPNMVPVKHKGGSLCMFCSWMIFATEFSNIWPPGPEPAELLGQLFQLSSRTVWEGLCEERWWRNGEMCQRRVPLQAGAKPQSEEKAPQAPVGAGEGRVKQEVSPAGQVLARLRLPNVCCGPIETFERTPRRRRSWFQLKQLCCRFTDFILLPQLDAGAALTVIEAGRDNHTNVLHV